MRDDFEHFLLITSYHEIFHKQVWAHFIALCKGYQMGSSKKFHMLFEKSQMQNKIVPNYHWEWSNLGHLK
jgi:hypothetical protein